jgi:tetratricopeptide (TPR) repeat protein
MSQPEILELSAAADSHFHNLRFAKACNLYERLITLDPDRSESYYQLGRALAHRERYDAAIAQYRKAIERGYDPAQVHCELGQTLAWAKKYDEAIVEYDQAAQISPALAEAYLGAGQAYMVKKDFDGAVAEFEKAITHCAQSASRDDFALGKVYEGLAGAREAKLEYEAAFDSLRLAFELVPSGFGVNQDLRRILPNLGSQDEALEILQGIVDRFDKAEAYEEWGGTLLDLGRAKQSIAQFIAAIRLRAASGNLGEASFLFDLALALKGLPQPQPEFAQVRRVFDDAMNAVAHCLWAEALAENSLFDESVRHIEQALTRDAATANVSDPLRILFDALELSDTEGARRQAIVARLQAVVESSDDAITRTRWGSALCVVGHIDEGLAQFKRATEQADLPDAHAGWGVALNEQQQFDQAGPHLLQAIVLGLRLHISQDEINLWWTELNASIRRMDTPPQHILRQAQELVAKVDTTTSLVEWARTLSTIGQTDQALIQLELALRKDARFRDAYATLLEIKESLDQKPELMRRLETTVQESQDSDANLGWGLIIRGLNRPQEAINYFERARTLDPENADAHQAAALAYASTKQFTQAIECHLGAIDADPTMSEAYTAWASAIGQSDTHEGVVAKLKWALALAESGDPAVIDWDAIHASSAVHRERAERLCREVERNLERSSYKDGTQIYIACGFELDSQGRTEEALRLFSGATQWTPDSYEAHNACGVALYRLGRYTEANEQHRAALGPNDDNFLSHWYLGRSLMELQQYQLADGCFSKVSEQAKQKREIDFFNDWSSAVSSAKEHDRALQIAQQALEMNPKYYWTYFRIAYIKADMRLYQQALTYYSEADLIELQPADASQLSYAHHNIADLYEQQGQYGPARKEWTETAILYHRGLEEAVGKRDSYYCLYYGWVLEAFNELDRAETLYRAARMLNPSEARIHSSLASVYLAQQKAAGKGQKENGGAESAESEARARRLAFESYKEARQLLERRLGSLRDGNTLKDLAELHLLMSADAEIEKEARAAFKEAIGVDPQSARAHKGLGELYLRAGRYDPAIRHLKSSLQYSPDDLSVRANLAKAYLRSAALDEAESEYQNVLNVARCHVDSLIGLGKLHLEKVDKLGGERDAARQEYFYEQAISLFSEAIEVANSRDRPSTFTESLASAYYLRGYARVQLQNSSRFARRRALVRAALRDFEQIKPHGADYHKAQRAIALIKDESLSGSSRSLMERGSAGFVFSLAICMFVLAQLGFFWGLPVREEQFALTGHSLAAFSKAGIETARVETLKPIENLPFPSREEMLARAKELLGDGDFTKMKDNLLRHVERADGGYRLERIQIGYYALLAFGALLFIIASAFLPQLTRLKVAGLELEKSTVERVETVRSIGIDK